MLPLLYNRPPVPAVGKAMLLARDGKIEAARRVLAAAGYTNVDHEVQLMVGFYRFVEEQNRLAQKQKIVRRSFRGRKGLRGINVPARVR